MNFLLFFIFSSVIMSCGTQKYNDHLFYKDQSKLTAANVDEEPPPAVKEEKEYGRCDVARTEIIDIVKGKNSVVQIYTDKQCIDNVSSQQECNMLQLSKTNPPLPQGYTIKNSRLKLDSRVFKPGEVCPNQ